MLLRAFAAAILAFFLIQTLADRHYATAAVLALLIGWIVLNATQQYSWTAPVWAARLNFETHDKMREIAHMTALLDAVSVALVTMRADGRITLVNRAARKLAGEDVARLADMKVLGPAAAETIATLPDGARQLVSMADGRPMLAWVGSFAAPGEPSQKLLSLQAVTGELDAVQLKAWMDMTRVLSHEIMNSLTPVASLSESLGRMLARQGDPGQDVRDALTAIERRNQHLMNFVERYRRIADLPAPSPAMVDVAAFMAEIEAPMQARLAERGIGYRSTLPAADVSFRADPVLLAQVFINLLHNAADAAEMAAQPSVTFGAAREENGILFSVGDNGPGIAPERRQEIFVPFFTTKKNGSGIGLTLARQIVLAHGGQIAAEENPGGGTLMRVKLPAALEDAAG
jgi:signal transduction histidine kinase